MDRREFITATTATVLISGSVKFHNSNLIEMDNRNIVTRQSPFTVKTTTDKLEAILKQKNITLYARINQQDEAAKAGVKLNDLEFLLFGNPQIGSQIMAKNAEAALDLPLKVLIWQDGQNITWVSYNSPEFIGQRYTLNTELAQLTNIDALVTAIIKS